MSQREATTHGCVIGKIDPWGPPFVGSVPSRYPVLHARGFGLLPRDTTGGENTTTLGLAPSYLQTQPPFLIRSSAHTNLMAKAKKKAKPKSQAEQSERFKAAAVEAGVDMSRRAFERVLEKIVPAKKRP